MKGLRLMESGENLISVGQHWTLFRLHLPDCFELRNKEQDIEGEAGGKKQEKVVCSTKKINKKNHFSPLSVSAKKSVFT